MVSEKIKSKRNTINRNICKNSSNELINFYDQKFLLTKESKRNYLDIN